MPKEIKVRERERKKATAPTLDQKPGNMKSVWSEKKAGTAQTKFLIDFDVLACPCHRLFLAFHLSQFFSRWHSAAKLFKKSYRASVALFCPDLNVFLFFSWKSTILSNIHEKSSLDDGTRWYRRSFPFHNRNCALEILDLLHWCEMNGAYLQVKDKNKTKISFNTKYLGHSFLPAFTFCNKSFIIIIKRTIITTYNYWLKM